MDLTRLARLGALTLIAIAAGVAASELRRDRAPHASTSAQTSAETWDPVQQELLRCRDLGEAGAADDGCKRAWAEGRRRFFAPASPVFDDSVIDLFPDTPAAPRKIQDRIPVESQETGPGEGR